LTTSNHPSPTVVWLIQGSTTAKSALQFIRQSNHQKNLSISESGRSRKTIK
jgi:hypothetical protein